MKKIIVLFFLLVVSSSVFTQTVDGNFIVLTNDGTTYSIKVQIKLQSGSQNLGNGTIRFSFNQNDLSFPASPVEGINYSFNNFQGGDYSSSVSHPNPNTVSINIAYNAGSGTAVSSTSYIDVATINFTTSNSAGNSNLVWGTRELYTISSPTAWILGSWPDEDTSPLPVELSSFTASSNQNGVNLKWQTATELNNYGFEIERQAHTSTSLSEIDWEKIGFTNGYGNSNSPRDYSFIDKNPIGGRKFLYRLKQIDNDGQSEYSTVVEVEIIPKEFVLYQNYPNPFNPSTKINYSVPFDSKVNISIYSITGELVAELVNDDVETGTYSVDFNGSNLASGMYFYRMASRNFVQTRKMILIK